MVEYLNILSRFKDREMMKTISGADCSVKTYADYHRDICRCAAKLEKILGGVEGRHIGIIGTSDYEYLVIMAAIIFSRGIAVPLNNREVEDNVLAAVKTSEAELIISDEMPYSEALKKAVRVESREGFFEDETSVKDLADFSDDEADRTVLILFTSGTTSLSKGVELSAGNLFKVLRNNLPDEYRGGADKTNGIVAYTNTPFYHVGGIMPWLSWTELGVTMCLSKDSRNILSDLELNRIHMAAVIPTVIKLWVKSLNKNKIERLGGVRYIYSGGAAVDPNAMDLFYSNGISVIQLYGMTETGGDITVNYDMMNHGSSVGRVAEGVSLSFIDGEICVDSFGNMKGYYKNPEETEKTLKSGTIYTGDLGYMDEDGLVYITGRKKNLIILSGGENISPEELENLLYKNPAIAECKVYEKDDRIWADAYAPTASESEIKEYVSELNTRLPIYKRIYNVVIKESELEKTASGKIKR
jgi:long-chain acyl-CoA synthetase